MREQQALELKVGLFIVSGAVLLIVFLFSIGDLATAFKPGYRVNVLFDYANGISAGSPVQYAGVEVGKVQKLSFKYRKDSTIPQVELLIWLPTDVKVRTDDIVSISTLGLLGDKFLEIAPGLGQGQILEPGGSIAGKPPVSTEDLVERSNQVLHEFQQTLQGLNTIVDDPEAHILLKEALQEARDATRHWRALGERLNVALVHTEAGQGNLGKLLFSDDLYQRMVLLVEDLRAHPWKLLRRPRKSKEKEK